MEARLEGLGHDKEGCKRGGWRNFFSSLGFYRAGLNIHGGWQSLKGKNTAVGNLNLREFVWSQIFSLNTSSGNAGCCLLLVHRWN